MSIGGLGEARSRGLLACCAPLPELSSSLSQHAAVQLVDSDRLWESPKPTSWQVFVVAGICPQTCAIVHTHVRPCIRRHGAFEVLFLYFPSAIRIVFMHFFPLVDTERSCPFSLGRRDRLFCCCPLLLNCGFSCTDCGTVAKHPPHPRTPFYVGLGRDLNVYFVHHACVF